MSCLFNLAILLLHVQGVFASLFCSRHELFVFWCISDIIFSLSTLPTPAFILVTGLNCGSLDKASCGKKKQCYWHTWFVACSCIIFSRLAREIRNSYNLYNITGTQGWEVPPRRRTANGAKVRRNQVLSGAGSDLSTAHRCTSIHAYDRMPVVQWKHAVPIVLINVVITNHGSQYFPYALRHWITPGTATTKKPEGNKATGIGLTHGVRYFNSTICGDRWFPLHTPECGYRVLGCVHVVSPAYGLTGIE